MATIMVCNNLACVGWIDTARRLLMASVIVVSIGACVRAPEGILSASCPTNYETGDDYIGVFAVAELGVTTELYLSGERIGSGDQSGRNAAVVWPSGFVGFWQADRVLLN